MKTAESVLLTHDGYGVEAKSRVLKQALLNAYIQGRRDAANTLSKEADKVKVYVGGNPIREGIKRGLRQGCISILSNLDQLKEVPK